MLYIRRMKTLGRLLGSAARTDVLRALNCQPSPLGLRPLARLAGVHPHSAELALAALLREGLVQRVGSGARPTYAMDRSHPDAAFLQAVLDAASLALVRQRRALLQKRARPILPFIREAEGMLNHARGDRDVT